MNDTDLRTRFARPEFPRAGNYDLDWVLENQMGPCAVWLVDALTQRIDLQPGMRVLDLGCGKAMTSIFLAREFDVRVVAADLWISPSDNWQRIVAAGEEARVVPLSAEAHALPFADGYFDAIVSIDAYHYFGTDDMYLDRVTRLLAPGGQFGIVVPGVREELDVIPPPSLASQWEWDFGTFHSPEWWARHWAKTGKVDVATEWLANGHGIWTAWNEIVAEWSAARGVKVFGHDNALLDADVDEILGFTIAHARRL